MQSGSRFVTSLHGFSKTNFKSTLFYPRKNIGFSSNSLPLYHTKPSTFSFANCNSKLINQFSYSTNATHHHKIAQAEVLQIDTAPPITPNEISNTAFPDHVLSELNKGFIENEVEIKPDGIIYLPEIKYRRVLNNAFGAGGWVMIPRGAPAVRGDVLYREYAMYCYGKFVSQAVGEQQIHRSMSEGTAVEASKSNSLMRCCKDLGIASELWDPNFIESWKSTYAMQVWCKNEKSGELKLMWRRKDRNTIPYPWKEQNPVATTKKYSPLRIAPSNSPQPTYQPSPSPPSSSAPSSQTGRKQSYTKSQPQSASKQKVVYDEIEEENVDTEGGQAQVDDVQEEDLTDEFDANEIVPAELKRFQGKTWDELFASPEGIQYLNWASKHPKLGEEPKQKVQSAIDWYSKSYPPQVE